MPVTYIVQQGPGGTGPWTTVVGSPFSSAGFTLTEVPGTYYFQITAQDLILGITGTPAVFGPYTTTTAESPAKTVLAGSGQSINASPTPGSAGAGNIVTIAADGKVAVNTQEISATSGVAQLYYTGASPGANGATAHSCYQENNSGNWYGPVIVGNGGTQIAGSPIPPGAAIAIGAIGTQLVNTPFTVSGTLTGYSSAPVLQYNDNAGAFVALPVSSTVSATTYNFTHPSVTSAETTATVGVEDANNTAVNATSNTFAVNTNIVGAPGVPTNVASPSQTNSTITVSLAPPTTGGALDFGQYQILIKTVAAGSYSLGPAVPYITSSGAAVPAIAAAAGYNTLVTPSTMSVATDTSGGTTASLYVYDVFGAGVATSWSVTSGVLTYGSSASGFGGGMMSVCSPSAGAQTTPGAHNAANGHGQVFLYGYFQITIEVNMQTASTWWPTFYLQGLGMSVTGDALELDILEVASQGTGSPSVYQSIHAYAPNPTGEVGPNPANNVVSPTYSTDGTSYNTFGLLWTPSGITFDINGKQGPTFSMSTSQPWVGEGGSTFSGNLTGNTLIGSGQYIPIVIGTGNSGPSMTISSVRVWQ